MGFENTPGTDLSEQGAVEESLRAQLGFWPGAKKEEQRAKALADFSAALMSYGFVRVNEEHTSVTLKTKKKKFNFNAILWPNDFQVHVVRANKKGLKITWEYCKINLPEMTGFPICFGGAPATPVPLPTQMPVTVGASPSFIAPAIFPMPLPVNEQTTQPLPPAPSHSDL